MKNIFIICTLLFITSFLYANEKVEKVNQDKAVGLEKAEIKSKHIPVKILYADEPSLMMNGMNIAIGEAIKVAITRNHDIISGGYDVAMANSDWEKYQKKYSIFLGANSSLKYNEYPPSLAFMAGETNKEFSSSLGFQKMFSLGTTLSGGMSYDYTSKRYGANAIPVISNGVPSTTDSIYLYPAGVSAYHQPVFFISVKQELLKNAFGYSERRTQNILKNVGDIKKNSIINGLSYVIVGVISEYWMMIAKRTSLDNAILKLNETRKVLRIVQQNVRYGLSEKFELNYYNALVAGAEANLEIKRKEFRDARRALMLSMNLENSELLGNSVVLKNTAPDLNFKNSLKVAYQKRADYIGSKLMVKNAKLQRDIAQNSALPSLTAEFNVTSMAYDKSLATAYSDTLSGTYPSFEGKIALTYPLDDREQKVNLRNSKFKLKQAIVQRDKIKLKIKNDVSGAIENIETSYRLYKDMKRARVHAEIYYYKFLKSMRKGRFSASTVKMAQDAFLDSKQREIKSLVGYNISFLQLEIVKNTFFEKFHIDVNNYIPKG